MGKLTKLAETATVRRKKLQSGFDSSFSKSLSGLKKANKVHRSDTGGTMKVLKGSLDPSQHDSSRLKYFGKGD